MSTSPIWTRSESKRPPGKISRLAGGWYDSGNGLEQILLEHWNGSTWSVSTANGPASNSFIYGVAASASNDVWAAGYTYGADFALDPLIQHWNGSSWTQVATPSAQPGQNNLLLGITAPSSTAAEAARQPR